MNMPQKIRTLRKKKGMTQLELAEALGVSRQAITGWETGTSKPSIENLQNLSRLYNISLEMLLGDEVAEPELGGTSENNQLDEESSELEQDKVKRGKRYRRLVIVVSLLLILITVAVLTHKGTGQEDSGELSFGEMKSATVDITGDTSEIPVIGFGSEGR